jgi:hypothetical protein
VNGLGHFLTRRPRAPKHGSDEQLLAAVAALPADHPVSMPLPAPVLTPDLRSYAEAVHPQEPAGPTFTPNARNLASTSPFPAPAPAPASHAVRGTHVRSAPRRARHDDGTLLRVRDRIRDLPLSRAGQFTADLQKAGNGGLPVFRAVVAARGFCGLDEEYLPAPLAMHGTQIWERWEQDSRRAIAAQARTAQMEIRGRRGEADLYEARVRDAAGAAAALGYPGEAL